MVGETTLESGSVAVRNMEMDFHLVVLDNYSQRCCEGVVGHSIESAEFIIGGCRWTILLFPNGNVRDDFETGYASLYLKLNSETRVQCLYGFRIIDQSGKGNHQGHHQGRSMFLNVYSRVKHMRYKSTSGYSKFIKRALLESSDYLKDDCLTIHVKIEVAISEIRAQPLMTVPEPNVGGVFGKLLESKEGADVFFRVDGERFCAHKYILASRSRVFRSLFSDAHQQHQEIVITDIQPSLFKAMLWFIYTGSLPVEEALVDSSSDSSSFILKSFMVKLLATADRFELKKLKKICESSIIKEVSVESAAYLLHLACLHHAAELKAACLKCIAENQDAVMESDGFEYLKENCPSLFLDLAGFKGNPFTSRNGEFDLGSKILATLKNSVFSMFCPRYPTVMMHNRKDL